MTDKELKSYRFSSGEEPSDQMLSKLMTNAARRVRHENKKTDKQFFANLLQMCEHAKAKQQ